MKDLICRVTQTNHAFLPHVACLEFNDQSLKILINLLHSQKSLSNIETTFFSSNHKKTKVTKPLLFEEASQLFYQTDL